MVEATVFGVMTVVYMTIMYFSLKRAKIKERERIIKLTSEGIHPMCNPNISDKLDEIIDEARK